MRKWILVLEQDMIEELAICLLLKWDKMLEPTFFLFSIQNVTTLWLYFQFLKGDGKVNLKLLINNGEISSTDLLELFKACL